MTWNAAELTTLEPGDRVCLLVASDEEGAHWTLGARVAAVELLECTGLPWADYFDGGNAPALLMDFAGFSMGLHESGGVTTLDVWIPSSTGHSEHIWLVPDPPR